MSTWLRLDDDVEISAVLRGIRALGYLHSNLPERGSYRVHTAPELTRASVRPLRSRQPDPPEAA